MRIPGSGIGRLTCVLALGSLALSPGLARPADGKDAAQAGGAPASRAQYLIGPGDEVAIWVRDADEISGKTFRVDESGEFKLPLVGWVSAGGLSVKQLEGRLIELLKPHLLEPDVQIRIAEYRSQPISVLGAVGAPGLLQLSGPTALAEVLSRAGGLRPEAGSTLRISRRKRPGVPPLPGGQDDVGGEYTTLEVDLEKIAQADGAVANLLICAHDVVTVSRAAVVYVIGEVKRAGGFALGAKQDASVLQALAMAEGMTSMAAPKKAVLLRPAPGETRREIAIDLPGILSGKAQDVRMQPEDILLIPDNSSTAKSAAARALQATLGIVTGVTILTLGQSK